MIEGIVVGYDMNACENFKRKIKSSHYSICCEQKEIIWHDLFEILCHETS